MMHNRIWSNEDRRERKRSKCTVYHLVPRAPSIATIRPLRGVHSPSPDSTGWLIVQSRHTPKRGRGRGRGRRRDELDYAVGVAMRSKPLTVGVFTPPADQPFHFSIFSFFLVHIASFERKETTRHDTTRQDTA